MDLQCKCGKVFFCKTYLLNRKKYCSKKCFYQYRPLNMEAAWKAPRKPNRTAFKKGHKPWNKNIIGLMPAPWNKGKGEYKDRINKQGYRLKYCPLHKYANKDGYVLEHRLVYETYIKRCLEPKEVIHHIDCNKLNNKLKNLQLTNHVEHMKIHHKLRNAK